MNYFSYNDKKLHKVAHEKCIELFDKKEKDNRTVPTKEIEMVKENFSKAFMKNCLSTSGRNEFCKCSLNQALSYMTEDKWKIIYFGEKENSTESDKQKYTDFLVRYIDNAKLGATKCLKKFPKNK